MPLDRETIQRLTMVPAVARRREPKAALGVGETAYTSDAERLRAFFGSESYSGKQVTRETALQLSTVWACVRQNAQMLASLPADVYRKTGDTREVIQDRVSEILSHSPNAEQTALEFWEGQTAWMMTNGNCYAEIITTGSQLSALHPLPANVTEPVRRQDGTIEFEYTDRGRREVLPADKVMHIKGFGSGGMKGLSAIRYGVHSMGAGLAADEAAARTFGNGVMPSGFLSMEGSLQPPQREQMREILSAFTSSENAGKVMVLENGLKFDAASLNPEDAQMLETRRFAVEDICRWFGTPPIVVGHVAQGQTMYGTGVESIMLSWNLLGLNPLMRRIEARIKKDLFRRRPRDKFEFNREGIMQADSKAKAEFLQKMVNGGIMTPNEARGKLNLPPVSGGDATLVQGGMITLDDLLSRNPE